MMKSVRVTSDLTGYDLIKDQSIEPNQSMAEMAI